MRHLCRFALLWCSVLAAQAPLNLNNLDFDAIDRSCKPCDDFVRFSIGKWDDAHPIPATQTRWSKRWAGADANLQVLQSITEELVASKRPAGGNEKLIGDFYAACTDTTTIESLGAKPVEPMLKRIAAIADRKALQQEIARLHAGGIFVAFGMGAIPDSDNPRQTVAGINPSALGMPDRDYYLKDDAKSEATRQRYLQHIQTLFKLAGQSPEAAAAGARTVLAVEMGFARERLTRVERRDPSKTQNHVPADKLGELTPHFDWAAYYRAVDVKLAGTALVFDLKFMKEFDRQLQETPLADWKAFLSFHVLRASARDLSSQFRQEMFEFVDKHLSGQSEPEPRWKFCVQRADAMLGDALGKAYVDKVFPSAAKARMVEMVKFILAAMKDSIQSLDWMTEETRAKALAKLASFRYKVGYPDKWRSYQGLAIARGRHFDNVAAATQFEERLDRAGIGKPVDPGQWRMTTPTSNAYYSPVGNEIVFPAGILVPPFFSLDADDAANYGAIGVVIGHEISHGFDDQGSQFDADGRFKNWWTAEDRKRFTERTQCVVDQFNNYFIEPGVAHNGKLVLGESIGDLAGLRIAYLAYQKSLEGRPRPADIGGFNAEQRFFLAWGQSRGDNTRIEQQRVMVVTDPHPVAKYRVIGPVSNMPEFRRAFGCKDGDAMVRPAEKLCRIW